MNPGNGNGDDITGVASTSSPLLQSRTNSRNHKKAGQNVLFGNGLVDFTTTAYCGFGFDNIYTALRSTPRAMACGKDSVLRGVPLSPSTRP